jgi:autotransporter translocation and assembly factor TamB
LLGSFGIAPRVGGKISADLEIGGTLARPEAHVNAEVLGLKSEAIAGVAPADVDVKATLADSVLSLALVARQRDIQPLTVNAKLPIEVDKVLANPAMIRELPLQGSVKLPASSLGFIPRMAPSVSRLDGTLAADIDVGGTVGRPVVNGEATLSAKSLRLVTGAVPPLSNLAARVVFSGDTISLREMRGEAGGGSFQVDGSIRITDPAQPVLDLRFRSDKVLLVRDESITIRADSDLTLRGPLNSANAGGAVFVTQSRFMKDVDILPLALPGRAQPQIRTVAAPKRISFPNPPLRDWKFDIAIETRKDDPFLIRGNLAKGEAVIDLRLGGTGLEPFLAGRVEIVNLRAGLPVSTLEIRRGYVTFSADDPFQPQLDIRGQTRIRKTTVNADLSGPATAPRLELDSEPPLPQAEIFSLLATGTTTGELGANASAIATKAALLTVKRWYRKVFRGRANGAPEREEESLLDRFEADVGNVDPKTGRPDVTASVRLSDSLYFLGEIDMRGQFIGRVRYLLRFR